MMMMMKYDGSKNEHYYYAIQLVPGYIAACDTLWETKLVL